MMISLELPSGVVYVTLVRRVRKHVPSVLSSQITVLIVFINSVQISRRFIIPVPVIVVIGIRVDIIQYG